jgi:hypothetical protein
MKRKIQTDVKQRAETEAGKFNISFTVQDKQVSDIYIRPKDWSMALHHSLSLSQSDLEPLIRELQWIQKRIEEMQLDEGEASE